MLTVERIPPELLPGRAAVWVGDRLWTAIAERGAGHLAVSGGSTPVAMFAALAALPLPWADVHIWQVDERVAPNGDPDRNAEQLGALRSVGAVIHLMDVTNASLPTAAAAYAEELPDRFDVIHLGLGDDGHTASWPPRDPVVQLHERVAVVGPFKDRVRLTLTPPVVNNARHLMFLVSGDAKRPMLSRLRAGDPGIPATAVRKTGTVVLTDIA